MTSMGFSLQPSYPWPMEQVISLLRDAGFCAVSPLWSPDLDMPGLDRLVRDHGMTIQSFHAPRGGLPYLWNPQGELSMQAQNKILGCIDACAQYQVPVTVIHGWQGLDYVFPETPLDFSIFDRIVDRAGEKGVSIAFENLEGEEYLQALLQRYCELPYVGYCWDSGHDRCYPHRTDFLETYGQRLIMTHLNDNFGLRDPGGTPSGLDDLHLLPGDGTADWDTAIARLAQAPKQKILNFEIKVHSPKIRPTDAIYDHLSAEEFFCLAGRRCRQIATRYEEKKA